MLKFSKTMLAASNSTETAIKGFWKVLLLTYDFPFIIVPGRVRHGDRCGR
jgi:hypothetical protein